MAVYDLSAEGLERWHREVMLPHLAMKARYEEGVITLEEFEAWLGHRIDHGNDASLDDFGEHELETVAVTVTRDEVKRQRQSRLVSVCH